MGQCVSVFLYTHNSHTHTHTHTLTHTFPSLSLRLIWRGWRVALEYKDLTDLNSTDKSEVVARTFQRSWDNEVHRAQYVFCSTVNRLIVLTPMGQQKVSFITHCRNACKSDIWGR